MHDIMTCAIELFWSFTVAHLKCHWNAIDFAPNADEYMYISTTNEQPVAFCVSVLREPNYVFTYSIFLYSDMT